MRILYAEDEVELRELVALDIEGEFDCDIVEVGTAGEAIAVLEEDSHFDLVISDFNMPGGHGGLIYNYILENSINVPFLLVSARTLREIIIDAPYLSPMEKKGSDLGYLSKPYDFDQLITVVNSLTKNSKASLVPLMDYSAVKLKRFYRLNRAICDVYISLAEDKYVKVLKVGDRFDAESLDNYERKGIVHLYVDKKFQPSFAEHYSETLVGLLRSKNAPYAERLGAQLCGYAFAQSAVKNLKIDEKTIEIVNNTLKSCEREIMAKPDIKDVFDQIYGKEGYIAEHSLLIPYIAVPVLSKMDWASRSTIQKIILASMFHDAGIGKEFLAKIRNLSDPVVSKLNIFELNELKNHPIEGKELLAKFPNFDSDVLSVVENHHETPGDNGFPKSLDPGRIPLLPCLFIIAEEIVERLYDVGFDQSIMVKTVRDLKEVYNVGNFKSIIRMFEQIYV